MGNRITLITGAAGALGSALARVLLDAGHRVALVDRPATGERLGELARELGGASRAVPLDVSGVVAWQQRLDEVERELGPIDGAVLTAGGWQGGAAYHTAEGAAAFEPMLNMNLNTVHRSFEALLPRFVAQKSGSIVVLGSRAVERPWDSANAAAYAASKAAVVALAQAVAQEVLEAGVRVNAVLPSTIDTPANRSGMPRADFSRWVSPSSLGGVIRFLLSDDARDISGAAIPVYGRA
jgi:NAD(P)-dependent dehydrogenase (short-subunit alcohol dehydrogenase family)